MSKTNPITPPKACFFDWDNTLVDTWPTLHAAFHHTMTYMGMTPWTLEEIKEKVHRSLRDFFPVLFGEERWAEARDIYLNYIRSLPLDRLSPLPGALEVLKQLDHMGIHVAVVSNKYGPNLRREVEHLGWNPYFKAVIGAMDTVSDKPDPTPVKAAMGGSAITLNQECWFIGDTISDMECAYNSGCTAVLYGEKSPDSAEFVHCRPHLYFPHYDALLSVMRTWALLPGSTVA